MFDTGSVQLTDDLDLSLDSSEYQDRALPMPILAGNYGVQIKKSGLKKEYGKDTLQLLKNSAGVPTYPVIVINELEVVRPEDITGSRRIFPLGFGQEFITKPFEQPDWNTGTTRTVNNIAEIVRSHDKDLTFNGLNAGLALLERLTAEGAVFYVQVDWVAEDRTYIKEQVEIVQTALDAGEIDAEAAKKAFKDIRYKQGRQEGIRKFYDKARKELNPVWVGPSGEEIEAKAFIRNFISQNQLNRFPLGPKKVG